MHFCESASSFFPAGHSQRKLPIELIHRPPAQIFGMALHSSMSNGHMKQLQLLYLPFINCHCKEEYVPWHALLRKFGRNPRSQGSESNVRRKSDKYKAK